MRATNTNHIYSTFAPYIMKHAKPYVLTAIASTLFALAGCAPRSLVPDQPSNAPDYFSTWNIQGYVVNYDGAATSPTMDEAHMFGDGELEGWTNFFPKFREDLYFLMDDSWDVSPGPHSGNGQQMGEARLDEQRFPSCTGEPTERLRALVDKVKKAGWKGLGGWICAQESSAAPDCGSPRDYWAARLKESYDAGVAYWKVDYGRQERNIEWRQLLTDLGRQHAPGIIIEHSYTNPIIETSDAFRTYDVEVITAVPVTIQRVANLLPLAHQEGSLGLINCEDEPYIAAGLGCAIGVMRHPLNGALPNGLSDHVFPATGRDVKSRMDEVNRLLKWHRIAEPFGVSNDASIDDHKLADWWVLAERETWVPSRHQGDTIVERAPARISRNLPLPIVTSDDAEPPYVMVSQYPNGAVAVATVERVLDRQWYTPQADISITLPDLKRPIGIFGEYRQLIIETTSTIPTKAHVWAQDLIGKKPIDITSQVTMEQHRLIIPGEVINHVGLMAATPDDKSAPGLVIRVK